MIYDEARDLANYLVTRGIDNESAGRDFGPCIIITPEKRNQIVSVLRSLGSRPAPEVKAFCIYGEPCSSVCQECKDRAPTIGEI